MRKNRIIDSIDSDRHFHFNSFFSAFRQCQDDQEREKNLPINHDRCRTWLLLRLLSHCCYLVATTISNQEASSLPSCRVSRAADWLMVCQNWPISLRLLFLCISLIFSLFRRLFLSSFPLSPLLCLWFLYFLSFPSSPSPLCRSPILFRVYVGMYFDSNRSSRCLSRLFDFLRIFFLLFLLYSNVNRCTLPGYIVSPLYTCNRMRGEGDGINIDDKCIVSWTSLFDFIVNELNNHLMSARREDM